MQCGARMYLARMRVARIREEKRIRDLHYRAARTIQRWQRGKMGRIRFNDKKNQWAEDMREYKAAVKMQSIIRREMALQRVDGLRAQKLDAMNKAATLMCRCWRGAKARKRYLAILSVFRKQEHQIVILQRFARGFVVRLRMWREAIRAEEELWAVLE